MKIIAFLFSIIIPFLSCSCKNSKVSGNYIYINLDYEWDIELKLFDEKFTLIDSSGCIKMSQKGRYVHVDSQDSMFQTVLVLKSSIPEKYELNDAGGKDRIVYVSNLDNLKYSIEKEYYFPLVQLDTLFFYNKDSCLFRDLVFTRFNGDVGHERVLRQEKLIISKIGQEKYIEVLGEGVGKEKARENLRYKNCR